MMTLTKFSKDNVTFPCAVQPKLDGVRCLINHRKQVGTSRLGNVFKNINHILDELPKGFSWDGELYIEGQTFSKVSGLLKNTYAKKSDLLKIRFHVFDIKLPGSFTDRLSVVSQHITGLRYCETVPAHTASSIDQIYDLHNKFVSEGKEGTVIRNWDSRYISDRSKDCQKLTDREDAEFEIIGCTTGEKDSAQAIWVCKTDDNQQFNVVGRNALSVPNSSYIGRKLKVRYKLIDVVPREPVCLGLFEKN